MKTLVSVIISTKNEERFIEPSLKSIKNQTYPNIEIIVSDACSNDNTVKIARKYADRVIVKSTNIPEGLNLGSLFSKGEILIFGKADTLFSPYWIENSVEILQSDDNIVAVYGSIKSLEKDFKTKILEKFWNILIFVSSMLNFHQPTGENILAVKRKIFFKIGKYDKSLVACEDKDIVTRLRKKGKVRYIPKNVSYTSFRRFKKTGYIKLSTWWIINYIYFTISKKNILKSYSRE